MEKTVYLDGNSLTLEDVVAICRHGAKVALTEEAKKAIQISRDIVEKNIAEEKVVYGLNTGFGKFVNVAIPEAELDQLQYNLIVSDACGVGDPFKEDVTRAIMLLRANALAKGFSGIRLSTVETLLEMLNRGVHPVIPEKGSVGSSGDLCPLAHMVMPMIGEGEAVYQGKVMSGKEAMEAAGIPIVRLKAKEGLALINGTCAMMGVASLAVYDAGIIIKTADISASLTVDALEGIVDPTNVGAIFRSAAALGMDGVLVSPTCIDPLCRRAVRVSMGTVFQVPWTYIGEKKGDWPQAGLERLRRLGFETAAMALDDRAVSIDDPRLERDRLALVLGTEGDGLSPRTVAHCDYTVCIPMARGVDSLNVAAASAVAFWEMRRR